MTDLEHAQLRLKHLQFGTLLGLLVLVPVLLKIGARTALRPQSGKHNH